MRSWLYLTLLVFASASAQQSSETTHSEAEREVTAVLDAFMAAFNARNAAAEERTYHFPHYRLASGKMSVLDAPGRETQAAMNAAYKRFEEFGWDRSMWTRRRIVHLSADKAHVDTQFTRYRKDGSVIGTYESLYVLTKENGRWGVKLRSSFAQ